MLEQFKKKYFFVIKTIARNLKAKQQRKWQHFLITGKHRPYPFLIFVFCLSQIKNYIIIGLVRNFFNAPCKRVTFSLQKRKHYKIQTKLILNKQKTVLVKSYVSFVLTLVVIFKNSENILQQVFLFGLYQNSPLSRRQCVSLLGVKAWIQISGQASPTKGNMTKKIFLRRLPINRILAKALRVKER